MVSTSALLIAWPCLILKAESTTPFFLPPIRMKILEKWWHSSFQIYVDYDEWTGILIPKETICGGAKNEQSHSKLVGWKRNFKFERSAAVMKGKEENKRKEKKMHGREASSLQPAQRLPSPALPSSKLRKQNLPASPRRHRGNQTNHQAPNPLPVRSSSLIASNPPNRALPTGAQPRWLWMLLAATSKG